MAAASYHQTGSMVVALVVVRFNPIAVAPVVSLGRLGEESPRPSLVAI